MAFFNIASFRFKFTNLREVYQFTSYDKAVD